jgi:putative transposase
MHTDRGSQYTGEKFRNLCLAGGIIPSVGATGICYEVSRRRESRPPPLSELCLTVSRYTAPVVEPVGKAPCRQWANTPG